MEDQILASSSRVLGWGYASALASSREVSPKDRKQQRWWSLSQRLPTKGIELDARAVDKAPLFLYNQFLQLEAVGLKNEFRCRLSDAVEILFLALRRFVF